MDIQLNEIKLGSVQETLLMPLWGRAVEARKPKPLLADTKAVSVMNSISYDFSLIAKNIGKISRLSWIARSIFFDQKIKVFTDKYPDATIVNIGCGLDTTFERTDNGKMHWFDLDLPDVISLRKKYIEESDRRHFIAASVFDTGWYSRIENKRNVMLLLAGVIYYFDEPGVKALFSDFHTFLSGAEVIFDYSSLIGIKMANKKVIEKGGMNKSACLHWGINDIKEIEKWESYIRVLSNIPMFREFKKNYPLIKRTGMAISDTLKVMSLAHITIS